MAFKLKQVLEQLDLGNLSFETTLSEAKKREEQKIMKSLSSIKSP